MAPRTASRLAWSIGIVSIVLVLAHVVLMFADRGIALPADAGRWTFTNVLGDMVNIAVPIIGIVLASKRPQNVIGWMFLAAGLSIGLATFGTSYALHGLVADPGSLPAARALAWVANCLQISSILALAFLFLLFPTGHLRSERWRPAAWFVGGACILLMSASIVFATVNWNDPFDQKPSSSSVGGIVFLMVFLLPFLLLFAVSLAAVIVRFRRSVGDERLQLKWFVAGAVLVVATVVATVFSGSPVLAVLQSLSFILLWTAIAVAVLKYRLYDVDIVISKAVVYGTLAVFITIVYVGLVVGVGTLVGNQRSPLLSAIAAAVIAVAFQPVRHRTARLANRLVYGKRATPYEVLSDFADRMAGTYSIDDVLPRTAQMLAEGTGAVRADVWLRVGSELRAEGSWPSAADIARVAMSNATVDVPGATRVVAVRHQDELLGALSVHKAAGDPMTATDDKLLADVAAQAGLVLRNARLIEELRASRLRLVTAQDEQRRKLERNIHDGAQQQLVALAVKLNVAQISAARDPAKVEPLLEQLKAEAQGALENLRDLARGIYPPLLADQGLVAALTAQAGRSPVPVRVEADGIGRFSRDAEAAVYFCALEALQNVAKYARATGATVELQAAAGRLAFEVVDDGVGFDPSATANGTGLQGMADRLAALGGGLEVTSKPGDGTRIGGWVPVDVTVFDYRR